MNETINNLQNDILTLRNCILQRIQQHFTNEPESDLLGSCFSFSFAHDLQMNDDEKTILLIALMPHLQPGFFESIIQEAIPQGGDFPQFGGVRGASHRGLLPTGETAQFIIAGDDLERRIAVQSLFANQSKLVKVNMIELEPVKDGEPLMSGRLLVSNEWLHQFFTGEKTSVRFGSDFPAKRLATLMTWDDLVLPAYTLEQISDIAIWLQHNDSILKDEVLKCKIKPGYRVLFHGSSGTGKTVTAALLGKQFGKDVYRIDLSQMVSKYIGETEKNLERVFVKAENQNWILFFDEADALFGKRTSVQSSHDRYANQEVSYLLQRVEDYPGLLILASNFKSNMDDAFLRRFHNIIHFPNPKAADRLKLWQKTLPMNYKTDAKTNLNELAEKYELNGAAIVNVVHYATLKSASRNDEFVRYDDLVDGIRKEYRKEERTMS